MGGVYNQQDYIKNVENAKQKQYPEYWGKGEMLPDYIVGRKQTTKQSTKTQGQQYIDNTNKNGGKNASIYNTTNNNTSNVSNTGEVNGVKNYLENINQDNIADKYKEIQNNLINAVNTFNKGDITDKIRLRTGGTADLDKVIADLEKKKVTMRAELVKKYRDIKDPIAREALINQEKRIIDSELNDLYAIRQYRLGTIQDMINGEIADKEHKIKALEYQHKIARDMMGDYSQAEKIKKEQEKEALELQKKYLELQKLQQQLQTGTIKDSYDIRTKQLNLAAKEDQYGYEYVPNIGNITITKGKTNNIPDRNNNPGNLKMGDVGYGVDKYGHTIFGDPKQGYEALLKDLYAKQTGNTRTGLNGNSTLADLGKVYAEDPNWARGVYKISGIPLDTKLKDIDLNILAPAIAKQEGFTGIDINGRYVKKEGKGNQIEYIDNVDDFLKIKDKFRSRTEMLKKLSKEQVGLILEDNIGKWKLDEKTEKALLLDAPASVRKKYEEEKEVYEYNDTLNKLKNADDNTALEIIKQLKNNGVDEQSIWQIVEDAGLLNRDYFDDGFIFDGEGYKQLKELLGEKT